MADVAAKALRAHLPPDSDQVKLHNYVTEFYLLYIFLHMIRTKTGRIHALRCKRNPRVELVCRLHESSGAFCRSAEAWTYGPVTIGGHSSFLLLVAMPGAPSSVLAPSSKARSP